MFALSREYIRNLAADSDVFADGFSYYKNGRVTHAVTSRDRSVYQFDVKGNFPYKVSVTFLSDSLEYSCNCSYHVKHSGACKHVIAALLFLNQFQKKTRAKVEMNSEDYRSAQILDYYVDLETSLAQTDICHLSVTFLYEKILRNPEDVIRLRLSIGNQKVYKVQNIRKLLECVFTGQNLVFGKDFSYRVGITEFDRSSSEILSYFMELWEMEKQYDLPGERSIFQKNELLLSRRRFQEVLHRLQKDTFSFFIAGRMLEGVTFFRGNPVISYDIDVLDDLISLNYSENGRVLPLSASGDLLYYNRVIYEPDRLFTKNYLPICNSLGGNNQPIVFRGENAQRFLEEVFPRLSAAMNLQIPEVLKERYVTFPLSAELYLEYVYGNIQATLRFCYGEYSFNNFEAPATKGLILLRDREKEQEIVNVLLKKGFEPHSGYYLLRDYNAIFDLVTSDNSDLRQYMTIFYSDSFGRLQVHKKSRISYGIHGKSGENYLTLELSYDNVPKEEMRDLLQSLQLKKRFYRLKDGSFLLLEQEELEDALALIQSVDGSIRQMREGSVTFAASQLSYLEETLRKQSLSYRIDDNLLQLLKELRNPEELPCPDGIRADVRSYQLAGYRWMKNLQKHRLGGILADDMGLGKTLQAIMYLASVSKSNRPSLVVCPSSLMYNWKDELENFAPHLSSCVICGTPEERKEKIQNIKEGIFITSYPLLHRDLPLYADMTFHTIIIDEAQNIKNPTSMNAISVKRLSSDYRFALTGTPIENSLTELWSIFDYLMPGYLFHHAKFSKFYERPIHENESERLAMLNARIQPFILRRMKQDVLKELPDKVEEKVLIELSEEQKKLYVSYLEHYRGEFQLDAEEEIARNRIQILSALMRLRQICCHPKTFIDNYQGGSSKLEVLDELIQTAVKNQHRVLVFSQFTSMLAIIKEMLTKRGITYFSLEGATKINERTLSVRQFNEGEGDVFLISLKAGGTGLNLIGADTVIHVEPWWNPAVEEQATDRAYRIGQKKNVHVIKILAKGTIEEKIYRLQKKKQKLADSVIASQTDFLSMLSTAELLDIFS